MKERDTAFEAWVAKARRVMVARALSRWHDGLKRCGGYLVGPCPACGGRDRFAINLRKNVWYCRGSGRGGDAIALVEYVEGTDFLGACEILTGRPAPSGEAGRAADPKLAEQRHEQARRTEADRAREADRFRYKEIRRAHDIWMAAGPIAGSLAESYLRFRGLEPPSGAKLRSLTKLPYWHFIGGAWKFIHQGPALVAAIQDGDGRFIGCHCTWIDGQFRSQSGKAEIAHPETGEILAAKKVRGSVKGGHIHLAGSENAPGLIVGEGIETVLAVRQALLAAGEERLAGDLFWAAISLGNLGGRAAEAINHPELTRPDKRGRIRRVRIPGPVPDMADGEALMPLAAANSIVLLGDGDSDRFTTEQVLRRAAARWARPGRTIRAAWADPGTDFNDMLRSAA